MKHSHIFIFILSLLLTACAKVQADTDLDKATKQFTELLTAVVSDTGLVSYDRLKIDQLNHKLNDVVAVFSTVKMPEDKDDKLAFLINAYNANVLAKVVKARAKPGFENVIKLSGFFDKDLIKVAGLSTTLNDLENKQIRPMGDARIHAALVCAAMSCPPLANTAYSSDKLDDLLDNQCKRWANDSSKFTVKDGKLAVSSILDWYKKDFATKQFASPAVFVKKYAVTSGKLGRFLESNSSPAVIYLKYDWSLNHQPK